MDRTLARAHAMKLIYEWQMGGEGGEETKLNLLEVKPGENEADFMDQMVHGVIENAQKLDEMIQKFLRGWTIERLAKVDLAILRLAAYELTLGKEPAAVIVNEAVELANQFCADRSGAFINGVLGNLSRSLVTE